MAAMLSRAPTPAALAGPPAPSVHVDAALRERIDLDNALRLWALGVRFATRDLVALGRPLELRLALPATTAAPLDELAPLGFEVAPLYGSHVMRVVNLHAPRVGARVVGLQGAPTAPDVSPLDRLRVDDFLVGIDSDDLLLAPSTGLAQVRKRILAACRAAIARGGGVVALRFVRLDTLVQVDPTRRVTHGSVLRALDRLEKTYAELKAGYDALLRRNREAAGHRLTRHKMLLGFGAHKVQMLRDAVRVDERYSFAAKFQQWYAAIVAETEYHGDLADDQDDNDGGDNVDVAMEPPVFEIDDDDDDDYGNDCCDDREPDVMSVPPVTVDPSQPPAQPRPAEIDIQWRHVLGPHEMKWLPMADAVLTNFIEGLVNGFASDGVWATEMVTRSRAMAERLVRMYAAKLVSSRMDNVAVKKEFTKHARMIRSNISNPGNRPLRQDVLSGVVGVDALCAMTSEQLAPKALQEDRQRRYEQHAKEITITAPTGPILMKTKHGFKEVNTAGTLGGVNPDALPSVVSETKASEALTGAAPVKSGSSPVGHTLDATAPPSSTSAPPTASRAANTADEVTQRLSVLGVNAQASDDTKAADPVALSSHNRQEPTPPSQPFETQQVAPKAPTLENVKVTPEDFRKFLMVMFDPAQDLEGMIGQLQSAIHSTSLSTMSNEFELAPGVTLYRDLLTAQSRHGSLTFRARVRLLNWTFLQESSNDREATMNALNQLLKELRENRRLFGGVLDRLRHECAFPQSASNPRAHHLAVDLLVRQGMAVAHRRMYHRPHGGMVEEYRADAKIGDLEIATAYADSVNTVRDRAARSVTAFLSELVALRNSIVHPPHQPTVPVVQSVEQMSIDRPRSDHERYNRDAFRHDDGFEFEDHRIGLGEIDYGQVDKKRPFDHSSNQTDTVQREPVRRKIEDSRVSDTSLREKVPEEPPCFVMDTKGEERRPSVDPAEKERKEKLQVETYQELLKELVRDRKQVKDLVKFDWNPSVAEQVVEFTRRLKVIRTISRLASSGDFVCSLQGLDGNLFITNSNASLKAAADYVTERMVHWLDGIYADWCNLADAYNRIVERKLLQRGQQADARLSAANETRKDRAVASFTRDEEKTRGALSEYTVSIRNITAIRQVCLNMKMAKRAAAEEFRDLMEWITKTRLEASRGQRAPQVRPTSQGSRASVSSTASSATTPARAPPKARSKSSNMVVCSDDSDDDDDDYHHDGGYSDDDDWHPQPKAPATGSSTAVTTHKKSGAVSVRTRVEDIIRQPYPLESERSNGDDARFRAVIRSLFTPEDALCLGISDIRGALKFQGRFDKVIVPNVKASIRLEMLRGEMFNVYASVNDVIHCRGTASSKPEACDMAVDGLLKELDRTRQVWTEMVHFFHTKELANNDPMDSFNALRLANITKIDTQIESPPSHHPHNRMIEAKMATEVHCVLYVGGKPMYRVNEAVESEAHTMATCRALRFFIDLIDKGLDPTPIGQQDLRFAPLLDADLRCKVILHEFSEFRSSREREVEFIADARWAIRGRAPSSDFGLPDRLTLNQIDRVPMPTFERTFGSSSDPGIFYFRLDATYENGKFVNHIAEYGNKNKMRAYVLHLEVLGNTDMDVYLFPPAASVNSAGNLYWSHKVMPREIEDYKAVYGYFVRRRPPQRN